MATIKSFDELNIVVGYDRSEPYEEYFDLDWLNDEERERRIALAYNLDEHFRPLILYLFYAALATAEIDWEYFESAFRIEYRMALESANFTVDDDVEKRIDTTAGEIRDSSEKRITSIGDMTDADLYYLSEDRLRFISENEAQDSAENEEFITALYEGKTQKEWISMRDNRVRQTHRIADSQVKPIMEPFEVGNSLMQFVGDSSLGADAEEIVGCRCHVRYF